MKVELTEWPPVVLPAESTTTLRWLSAKIKNNKPREKLGPIIAIGISDCQDYMYLF